ncbi:BZ3500_MvSof-1268-A1-R1_Chr1-1g01230 [Microbotryum saponariae]|uniref:BZ3500_MvSof-1268-A1-R1_Chr1-1g01230 protein n=1 Tax=Microbotryum saponariae TaxID=289078 RepID=A0A2X0LCX1_9BASI|nr:BZ3500_MvSof-1268-A1-R1_Chr1-1g01230 [Microbotryum saponariae]SCZ93733.1 BZ3501_MvSof-1269-A2-R1_Chr1-1g00826 [Microbotryum saponariae]
MLSGKCLVTSSPRLCSLVLILLVLVSLVSAEPSPQNWPFKGKLQPHVQSDKRQAPQTPLRLAKKKVPCDECARSCWDDARNVSRTWRYCSDTCGCKSVAYY